MFRLMQQQDIAAVELLQPQLAKGAAERFAAAAAGYVDEENGTITAAALAVPAALRGHRGFWLYGACGQCGGLIEHICAQQKQAGAQFAAAVPANGQQAELLGACGFEPAFAVRSFEREIRRNLWSTAEFDTVTARKLCELRAQFWPDTLALEPKPMAAVLSELYARGATIVSNPHGYGIYFRKESTLCFAELMAEGDREAEKLMEAAREKEIVAEKAAVTVGAAQQLFIGEGKRAPGGMIRFLAQPFDVSESCVGLIAAI